MSLNLGTLFAAIKLETKDFVNEMDDITRRFDRFLEAGADVAKGLTKAFTGWVQMGIETESMLDSNTRAFRRLAGGQAEAEAFMGKLRSFAVATPFEFEGVADTVKNMQAMGVELDNTIPLMQIFGDKASSAGKGAENVKLIANAFTQVMGAGKLMGQEMKQFIDNGISMIPILTKAYGKTPGEIRSMMEAGQLDAKTSMTAVLRDMVATSQDAMQEMNNTFGGRWNSIMESFKLASADALKPLYDQLTALLPIAGAFGTALLNVATQLVPYMMVVVDIIGKLMLGFVSLDENVQKWIVSLTLAALGAFIVTTAVASIIFAVASATAAFATFALFVGTTGLGVIAIVSGIAIYFLAALAGLAAFGVILFGIWNAEWFQPVIRLIKTLNGYFVALVTDLGDLFSQFFQDLLSLSRSTFSTIAQGLATLVKGSAETYQSFLKLATNLPMPGFLKEGMEASIKNLDVLIAKAEQLQYTDIPKLITEGIDAGSAALPKLVQDGVSTLVDHYTNALTSLLPEDIRTSGASIIEAFTKSTELAPVDLDKLLESLFKDFTPPPPKGSSDWMKDLINNDVAIEWEKLKDDLDNMDKNIRAEIAQIHAEEWFQSMIDRLAGINFDPVNHMVDELTNSLENVVKSFEDFLKAQKEARDNFANKITGGLGLDGIFSSFKDGKMAFGGALGGLLKTGADGALGIGGLGGALGGIIGVIIELVTKTEAFAYVLENVNKIIGFAVGLLDKLLIGVKPLVAVIAQINEVFFNTLAPLFSILGQALQPIGAVLIPMIAMFKSFGIIITSFTEILRPLIDMLDIAFAGLYYALMGVALVMMAQAWAVGQVWNLMVNALVGVLELIGKIPGVGKAVDKAISALEDTLVNTQLLEDQMTSMLNTSWDEAKNQANAQAEATAAVEETTEAMHQMREEMINVPEGYKVALARFTAMAADTTQITTGGAVTRLARGGIVTKPTYALVGEAGPEAVIPLSRMGVGGNASTIHIETVIIQTDNIEDMARQIEQIADRNAFLNKGTPVRVSKFRGR